MASHDLSDGSRLSPRMWRLDNGLDVGEQWPRCSHSNSVIGVRQFTWFFHRSRPDQTDIGEAIV